RARRIAGWKAYFPILTLHTDHGKAFFSKPLQMPNGLDSRLRGNDGIGLPLQHGFFRFYVLDSRLRGNDGSFIIFEYYCCSKVWIPACAGMTAERFLFFPINS
ncbi:hypothetical protein, partial [Neisseria meningitidis]|uniref:hypothetical protein n=1 Tax=Neisseria meningitidis TaxID=487 RepID=UPI00197B52F7